MPEYQRHGHEKKGTQEDKIIGTWNEIRESVKGRHKIEKRKRIL